MGQTTQPYAKMNYLSDFGICNNSQCFWQWKLQAAVDYSLQNWKYGIEYLYSHNFGEN